MLYFADQPQLDDKHWRRINMRKVAHLIGAEMIHNLYNRHWPRINSLRFRHTITNFNNGIVESYAPINEWSYLQRWLSEKFIALDPVLLREIEAIFNPSYEFVDDIMSKIDKADLEDVSNKELALMLIDIMDFPLGDIYKLNVVQIEYSLNFALHRLLEEYEPSELDRNELLARLIAPGELTVAQEEEVTFSRIITTGKDRKAADPKLDDEVMSLIRKHYEQFAPTHCAYGEVPPSLDDYLNKYRFIYDLNKSPLTAELAIENVKDQLARSQEMLARLGSEKITRLCRLMAQIGVFRDKNKAKLGETVIRRLKILDEISRRTGTIRDDLNYYLMSELTNLLDIGQSLDKEALQMRKKQGISFVRNEDVILGSQAIASNASKTSEKVTTGICASAGNVTGPVKIVHSSSDIGKIESGDIMVAVGTDFDLLEIMNQSSGIITEEGGLLSHASVVSRELKKPCLIGVANATAIFKDGDILRLNATEGKITIIKQK